jgi:hypothetical protein
MDHRPYELLNPDEMATWDQAMRRAEDLRDREPDGQNDDQVEDDETDD